MKKYEVSISTHAAGDIQDIARHISSDLHEPVTAERLINNLQSEINELSALPFRFALVTDKALAEKGFRKMPVENYIVFYMVNDKEGVVNVLRVLYGKRDWVSLI